MFWSRPSWDRTEYVLSYSPVDHFFDNGIVNIDMFILMDRQVLFAVTHRFVCIYVTILTTSYLLPHLYISHTCECMLNILFAVLFLQMPLSF